MADNTYDSFYEIKRRCTGLYAKYPFLDYCVIGKSRLYRDMFSLSIGNRSDQTLIIASPNASSLGTPTMLTDFLEELSLSLYKGAEMAGLNIRRALQDKGITIIPFFNPDGYDFALHGKRGLPRGAKYSNELDRIKSDEFVTNIGGVDLYYNFSKSKPGTPYTLGFSGYSPLSEPESLNIAEYCRKNPAKRLILCDSRENAISYFDSDKNSDKISLIISAACFVPRVKLSEPDGFLKWYQSKIKAPAFKFGANADYARLREALTLFSIM